MKTLKDFINESMVVEAAPKFEKSVEGVKAFCDYVYDKQFYDWVVNPDLSITISIKGRSQWCYIHAKDLVEIPDFITYSNIPDVGLGITDANKLKRWAPNVNGTCKGVDVSETCKKIEELDLTNCECKGGKLVIEKTPIKKIIGGNGDGVQVFIKMNKNLEYLDLRKFVNCMNPGSYITKNKKLKINPKMIPSEIDIR